MEIALGTIDSTGDIRVQFWNGSTWTATKLLGNLGTTWDNVRSFDMEYENANDRLVVVYASGLGNVTPKYSVWDGSTWVSDNVAVFTTSPAPTTGWVSFVEMARNPLPDNNEIALIYADANHDVMGYRWTGTAWDNMGATTVWDTTATLTRKKPVGVAYESITGNIMFMWADNTATYQQYRLYENTPRVLSASIPLVIATQGSVVSWIQLVNCPFNDNILYGYQTQTAFEVGTIEWNGTAWNAASSVEHDTGAEDTLDQNFGIAYEGFAGSNGRAWIWWGDSATVSRRLKTSGWGAATATGDDTARVLLYVHPVTGTMWAITAQDSTSTADDLYENKVLS